MSTQTRAATPEALHAAIEDAFNRGDLDSYVAAYDEDATLIVPPDGVVAQGRENIRSAMASTFARSPRMRMVVVKKVQGDGVALTYGRWALDFFDTGDTPTQLSGRGALVSRRRSDGSWGIVLDDPLRPE